MNVVEQISHAKFFLGVSKDVHIVVPFAYLLSSYSKFEWAENAVVQATLTQKSWAVNKFTVRPSGFFES